MIGAISPTNCQEELMAKELVDCLGRCRSPATTSAFHVGRPPRNRGMRYPADPPPVEEIIAVMCAAGAGAYGDRLRGVMVVCWRAGLRVGEALALAETDLDPSRGAILIRKGKGGKRREVGMDRFGWEHLDPWLERRRQLPVGALFLRPARPQPRPALVAGRGPLRAAARRRQGRRAPALGSPSATPRARGRDGPRGRADGRHRAPARACQPRDHLHLFQGIDNAEIIDTVHRRAAPVIPASSRLRSPLAL